MRAISWFCMFFAFAAAGSAEACLAPSHAVLQATRISATQIAGGIWLPPRPLPGTMLHMPEFTWPLTGPHGGRLAAAQVRSGSG